MSNSHTSFREHFSHNEIQETDAADKATDTCPMRLALDRNDLGVGLQSREQADRETRSPCNRSVLAFVFVSHICSHAQ